MPTAAHLRQTSPPLRNFMRWLRSGERCGSPVDCGWVASRSPEVPLLGWQGWRETDLTAGGFTVVRAAVVAERNGPIDIGEAVLPDVGPDQVRVKVAAAGICHSDLSMINGTLRPSFPLVLGHEASGVVAEVGANVTRVSAGDRVVINW